MIYFNRAFTTNSSVTVEVLLTPQFCYRESCVKLCSKTFAIITSIECTMQIRQLFGERLRGLALVLSAIEDFPAHA